MLAKDVVRADAEAIYLGNIFTVEADLTLPEKGQNGSTITWETERPHTITEKGKVTRPREGMGNREVTLTATVSFGGETAVREFLATVLALKSDVKLIGALNVEAETEPGADYKLPGVCVVVKDDKTFATKVVTWNNVPDFKSLKEGVYTIMGETLSDSDVVPKAVITVKPGAKKAETAKPQIRADRCDYGDVKITGGYFNDNRLRAEDFLLSCDLDTMLYNFRAAAGLDTKNAAPMTGWDAPEGLLRGHTTGHFLSAIALACAGKTENEAKFRRMVDYMAEGLKECQDAMENSGKYHYGFLSAYSEEQFDKLEEYVVYPKIWAPYYTLHKILSGLLDCREFAGSMTALDIAAKIGTWTYDRLSKLPDWQLQKMWSMYIAGEFGGINESLARLAKHTGKPEHVKAAKLFDNERLFYPMARNIDTLGGIHGNQHVPQVIGALEIYKRTGEKEYYDIARNFWHIVTASHIYNIGGTGEGEMFRDPHDIGGSLSEKTAESCVSYNMLKLAAMLFAYEPKSEYMDYCERTLYNHIAASQDQSGPVGGNTYFMPLQPGGRKKYDKGGNTCCHGTGLENHVKYQDAIYFTSGKTVYINLYIPSVLDTAAGVLCVANDMLTDQKAVIKIEKPGFSGVRLRIPSWTDGSPEISLNGGRVDYAKEDGYAVLNGDFKQGDTIEIALPFSLRAEATIDAPDVTALYYGPLVLVAVSDSDEFLKLEKGFVHKLEKTGANEFKLGELRFIPNYYAWDCKYHAYVKTV